MDAFSLSVSFISMVEGPLSIADCAEFSATKGKYFGLDHSRNSDGTIFKIWQNMRFLELLPFDKLLNACRENTVGALFLQGWSQLKDDCFAAARLDVSDVMMIIQPLPALAPERYDPSFVCRHAVKDAYALLSSTFRTPATLEQAWDYADTCVRAVLEGGVDTPMVRLTLRRAGSYYQEAREVYGLVRSSPGLLGQFEGLEFTNEQLSSFVRVANLRQA